MKVFGFLLVISAVTACAAPTPALQDGKPVSHEKFTILLQKYVNDEGKVDYKSLKENRAQLTEYLDLLRSTAPNEKWSKEEEIAYWINVYNAFTLDLILEHYPVESIKDIGSSIQIPFVNTPWDIKFIKISGEEYDLNNVEHGILRKKWKEPGIHFAVNCASKSCPKLRREAYTADKLYEQFDEQARIFINSDFHNDITPKKARLSKYFDWYGGDFKDVMPIREYINQYADVKLTEATEISYKDYNWELNEQ